MSGSKFRNLNLLEVYRDHAWGNAAHGWAGDETCGCFRVPSPIDKADLRVIASSGEGWDHVSVSRATRCPNWIEMEHVKRMFFKDDAVAFQLHMPPSQHINVHQYCLHIWRPHDVEIPLPPSIMVAPSEGTAA